MEFIIRSSRMETHECKQGRYGSRASWNLFQNFETVGNAMRALVSCKSEIDFGITSDIVDSILSFFCDINRTLALISIVAKM